MKINHWKVLQVLGLLLSLIAVFKDSFEYAILFMMHVIYAKLGDKE
jgi:hypothetical protein